MRCIAVKYLFDRKQQKGRNDSPNCRKNPQRDGIPIGCCSNSRAKQLSLSLSHWWNDSHIKRRKNLIKHLIFINKNCIIIIKRNLHAKVRKKLSYKYKDTSCRFDLLEICTRKQGRSPSSRPFHKGRIFVNYIHRERTANYD